MNGTLHCNNGHGGNTLKFMASFKRRQHRGVRGEATLWLAVLCRGIKDAMVLDDSSHLGRTARVWINSEAGDVGSIRWICDQLDIGYLSAIRRVANDGAEEDYERLKRILFSQ